MAETCTNALRAVQEQLEKLQRSFWDQNAELLKLAAAVAGQNSTVSKHTEKLQELDQDIVTVRTDIATVNATSQLTENTLSPFLEPLHAKVADLNAAVAELNVELPLGHVYGNGDIEEYNGGVVVTHWTNTTAQDFTPILKGNMTFNGSIFTIPTTGIYYIYGQLRYAPFGPGKCGFSIQVGAEKYLSISKNAESLDQYSSQVTMLQLGDEVSMTILGLCRYRFERDTAFFGLFLLL